MLIACGNVIPNICSREYVSSKVVIFEAQRTESNNKTLSAKLRRDRKDWALGFSWIKPFLVISYCPQFLSKKMLPTRTGKLQTALMFRKFPHLCARVEAKALAADSLTAGTPKEPWIKPMRDPVIPASGSDTFLPPSFVSSRKRTKSWKRQAQQFQGRFLCSVSVGIDLETITDILLGNVLKVFSQCTARRECTDSTNHRAV